MTYIFINQATRYLFVDIINCFAYNGCKVELYAGEIREGGAKVDTSISKHLFQKYNSKTPFHRLYTFLVFTLQVFFKLLFHKKKDIRIILVTTPPFIPFIGIFFHRYFGISFDLIVYDLYPDVLINFGLFKEKSFVIRIWNGLNRKLYHRVSNVFTISHSMAKRIEDQGCDQDKIVTISNWVDSTFIKPIAKSENPFIKRHYLEGKFVVIYSGNMGATHDLESLIAVAEQLKDETCIQFLLIGEGVKKQKIEKMIDVASLQNVKMLPLQPSEILPYSLSSGDLAYITLDDGAEHASVPSKFFYMLAAGCGILSVAKPDAELGVLTTQYNVGKLFEPGDIKGIGDFIIECMLNKEKLSLYQKNARTASFDFTPENAIHFYKAIIHA